MAIVAASVAIVWTILSTPAHWRWRTSVRLSCAPPPQLWVCAKSPSSTTTISISTVRIPARLSPTIVGHIRRVQPDVVVTFGPDGAYGHPDHIAISQFTTAAIVAAADPAFPCDGIEAAQPHAVSKLYYMAWPESTWKAYQSAFRKLVSTVDGIERQAVPWPDWAITTVIDTRSFWSTVWRAICCHESQVTAYERLKDLSPDDHEALWGRQSFYRVFSTVTGGRVRETDLLEGIRT